MLLDVSFDVFFFFSSVIIDAVLNYYLHVHDNVTAANTEDLTRRT